MKDNPYRFRIMSRQRHEPRDPRYTYDALGRREYASGITRREAETLVKQANTATVIPDVLIEEHLGTYATAGEIWKEVL